jgi:hypothetical protein
MARKGPHDVWSYKGDAAHSGFGNSTIRDIWIRVAEDFLPFNINVTTDAKVYENATRGRRIRCIITSPTGIKPVASLTSVLTIGVAIRFVGRPTTPVTVR